MGPVAAIAADGRSMWGDQITADRQAKMHSWGPTDPVVVIAGELRLTNILEAMTQEEKPPESARAFADRLRELMLEVDWKPNQDGNSGSPAYGFSGFYLSLEGLWVIACDFAVFRVVEGWPRGLGSGGDYATGAMSASGGRSSLDLVTLGIEVGKRLDNGSGGGTMIAVRSTGECRGPEWVASFDDPTPARAEAERLAGIGAGIGPARGLPGAPEHRCESISPEDLPPCPSCGRSPTVGCYKMFSCRMFVGCENCGPMFNESGGEGGAHYSKDAVADWWEHVTRRFAPRQTV